MMSIAMDIKYPDLFAASFIVARQWDVTKVVHLTNDKLWIVVPEGGLKAYPGENEITTALEKLGAKVSRAVWSGLSTPDEFASAVQMMAAEGSPINYVALQQGRWCPLAKTTMAAATMSASGGSPIRLRNPRQDLCAAQVSGNQGNRIWEDEWRIG